MKIGGIMNPIETLKEGIENNDWTLVVDAYNTLTGDHIAVSKQDDEPLTLHVLRNVFREELAKHIKSQPPELKTREVPIAVKSKADDSGPYQGNLTEEETGELTWDKKPMRIITGEHDDSIPQQNRRTPRKIRSPRKTYKVECNQCKKEFKSDRKSDEIGQKCNSCLVGTPRVRRA